MTISRNPYAFSSAAGYVKKVSDEKTEVIEPITSSDNELQETAPPSELEKVKPGVYLYYFKLEKKTIETVEESSTAPLEGSATAVPAEEIDTIIEERNIPLRSYSKKITADGTVETLIEETQEQIKTLQSASKKILAN
jgi:hypothetical protein